MLQADKERYKMENGGSMLGDLDKDGKLSGYEKARQDAIEENMREQYVIGGLARILSKSVIKKLKNLKAKANKIDKDGSLKNPKDAIKFQDESIKVYEELIDKGLSADEATKALQDALKIKVGMNEGGPMDMDDQMMMVMTPPMESEMESDDDMEDGYTRFIMEEALSEEEEDMLMSKLEQDEELAMLFDKVIDVAQEFAGAGPVEGPGSGVSDSIPARLSDGEFVFTAKAVEEIGADKLMAMMKDAEAKADERQPLQTGGAIGEEETMATKTPMTEQVIRVEKGPQTEQVGVGGSLLDSVREEENPLYEEMAFKRPPVHGAGYGR